MDKLDQFGKEAQARVADGYYDSCTANTHPRTAFTAAIRAAMHIPIIAEIKFAAPSAPSLAQKTDKKTPANVAEAYKKAGAACISVLTEPSHFNGALGHLADAKKTGLPVLMKDFIVSTRQIDAAAACGADAVLLIMTLFERRIPDGVLAEFIAYAHEHGIDVLLEVATVAEYKKALGSGADCIGINNRDLRTLEVDIYRTLMILDEGGKSTVPVISMSGIQTPDQIRELHSQGADGFLIGSSLMAAGDSESLLKSLVCAKTQAVKICGLRGAGDVEKAQGADYFGFVVDVPVSKRNIDRETARAGIAAVPPGKKSIVVTTLDDAGELGALARDLMPDYLQVHAPVSRETLEKIRAATPASVHLITLIEIDGKRDAAAYIAEARSKQDLVTGILLDTKKGSKSGGTGLVHDWTVSRAIRDALFPVPVILAGGVTPENVCDARDLVCPCVIDASSGVEDGGIKSREKIQSLLRAVKT